RKAHGAAPFTGGRIIEAVGHDTLAVTASAGGIADGKETIASFIQGVLVVLSHRVAVGEETHSQLDFAGAPASLRGHAHRTGLLIGQDMAVAREADGPF